MFVTSVDFWVKLMMASAFNLELDLPLTGIINLEEHIGMPSFEGLGDADYYGNQVSHFQVHYASQVALRRVCYGFHRSISDCEYALL